MSSSDIRHNAAASRFETQIDDHIACVDYELDDDVMRFTRTRVPEAIGGRGVAGGLVRTAMEFARERGYRVVAECSYVAAWLERHPDYRDLQQS